MLDEDFNREELMETFPVLEHQIIVDGQKIGGFTEFKALVDVPRVVLTAVLTAK